MHWSQNLAAKLCILGFSPLDKVFTNEKKITEVTFPIFLFLARLGSDVNNDEELRDEKLSQEGVKLGERPQ